MAKKIYKVVFIEEGEFDEEGTKYGYSTLNLYYIRSKDLKEWAKKRGVTDYTKYVDEHDNDAIAELSWDIDKVAIKKSKIKVKFDLDDSDILNERKGVLYLYPAI